MAESQSRFSIVEELTNKKFGIDEAVEEKQQAIENNRVATKRSIEKLNEELKLEEERTKRFIESAKQQKTEIEKALDAIEKISESQKKEAA